jgi:small subunit ribosomal protein S9
MTVENETVIPAGAAETPAPVAATPETPAVVAPVVAVDASVVEEVAKIPAAAAIPATGRREGDRAFGVGRRKTAVARAMMVPGTGKFLIKGRESSEYLRRPKLIDEIQQPFVLTGTVKRFDVTVAVSGGSLAGQAGAIRLACARALSAWQPEFRAPLSTNGLLTRDPRMVERKKYGIRGARRRPQWTKR